MLPIVEQLLVIQDRDSRIAHLRSELERIPTDVAAVDARLAAESARLETMRQEVKHLETERKKLEIEAESQRAQIAKYRGQLLQIKSNVEYQALLKEIAKAESDVRGVEDRELEFMEQTAQEQPALREEQALVTELTGKAQTDKTDLQQRAVTIEQELAQLKADRDRLAQGIEPGALARYERLMRSKGDAAVVPVQNGNCGGCHLHIPPQVAHDAKFGVDPVSCDYCGRILYCPRD